MNEGKDTYKYQLKRGHKVILRSITYDLTRREAEHQQEYPGSRVKQIGRKTTHRAALAWERSGGKRPYHMAKELKKVENVFKPHNKG